MNPWIERDKLVKDAKRFVRSHGYFLRENGARISSLAEIAVYNSFVRYYESLGFKLTGENLGPKNSFRYKLTASGLGENYSYFKAERAGVSFHILNNISLESAHEQHIYFTADVAVASGGGATTKRLKGGRRHTFVTNANLVTFAEVKHLNPFPEVLFNFMGLVLEFMPGLVEKTCLVADSGENLCPVIAFTGSGSEHSEKIQNSLTRRYGINIVFSTNSTFGRLRAFDTMKKYVNLKKASSSPPPEPPRRMFRFEDEAE